MAFNLSQAQARVLGCLLEKEATTPEYYPLSLNALVNACNQKTNRWPVVDYDESTVVQAVEELKSESLAAEISGGGRVHKYAQRITERLNLGRPEAALLCTLLLRGPQTLGELRDRSERIYRFDDLEAVETTLERMMREPGGSLVVRRAKQPGRKEVRFAQLLSAFSEPETEEAAEARPLDRLSVLETEMDQLKRELIEIRAEFAEFRKQFE